MSFELGALCAGLYVTGHVVGRVRRGSVRKHVIGASQIEVAMPVEPTNAFEAIRRIDHPYRVDDADAASLRLVLSTNPTVFSWGFLYPIEIAACDGGSTITVGIRSKFLSAGIVVRMRAHERCARAIKALFAVPPMRLA